MPALRVVDRAAGEATGTSPLGHPSGGVPLPPFTLPNHVEVDAEILRAVAARHGLDRSDVERLPDTGIINAVYRFGRHAIVRIPRNHPDFVADARREVVAVPAARAVGVRTPALLAFDDRLDLLPVPYTVYERVPGASLESLPLDPADTAEVWREHGRTLACIHAGVTVTEEIARLGVRRAEHDPHRIVDDRAEQGWLSHLEARWLGRWLDRLAPAALEPMPPRFLHGDTQAANVMVRPEPLR
jgi:aminoglycoside phosphotransferase (APT) family kinase protein